MSVDEVDLLVIGAGMAGLTAAARAARDGLSVLVVDVAAAESARQAAVKPPSTG